MAVRMLNLQDHFLNSCRKSHTPLTIFLVKGVKLQGVVTWFDAFCVLLRRDGVSQLVYKHSISTIMAGTAPRDFSAVAPVIDSTRSGIQDRFLAAAAREHDRMTIFLVNGVMLQGVVTGFDQFSVVLERAGQIQLVYKHAISTLQPSQALVFDPALEPELDDEDDEEKDAA